ncbi:endo-1,4-beta-xylanase [Flammeovirga agarivorans]|uniref:endo-1,4-beta-xylanase n=1 Tax=Flammeovirga agarivorans TaxID=2726742 RepID=A0A7X8SPE5_9BACT|nr:endo-1,4-beta-xylanase [Flammeovirga agarivorans]NLR93951.1 hypothetical protein [Flammeovirga agarivorans]
MKQLLFIITTLISNSIFAQDFPFFDGTDKKTNQLMSDAQKQIEEVRKGNFTLNIDGVDNKKVTIELVKHDFTFGTDLYGLEKMDNSDPIKKAALTAIDDVFNTVIVCDYWSRTQKKQNQPMNWKMTDYHMKLAKKHNKDYRYHALFFSYPKWFSTYSEEELWGFIEQRIKDVIDKYGNDIPEIDVINEFINWQYWENNPHAKYLKTTNFPDFADPKNGARVLKLTRKYMPNTKLVVLETNLWSTSNPVYQEIYDYHKSLIEEGVDYDYIGYQGHYYALKNKPFQKGTKEFGPRTFMMDDINAGIEKMASLGKRIVITEFNPPSRSSRSKNPNQVGLTEKEVAAWEKNFYTLMFSKPYIDGISRWFTIDNVGGKGMDAGVIDEKGKFKPNYYALKKLIKEEWHTSWSGKVSDSSVKFNGFYGTYKVSIEGQKSFEVKFTKEEKSHKIDLSK